MFGRAEVRGFDDDDRQPDGRREPYPQDSLGGWSQLSIVAMQRAEEAILLTEVNDIGICRQLGTPEWPQNSGSRCCVEVPGA
jgi:hypothetical protein